jgi:hypothetical protein
MVRVVGSRQKYIFVWLKKALSNFKGEISWDAIFSCTASLCYYNKMLKFLRWKMTDRESAS